MSFTATVHGGTIKLPPDVHLPDGTEVSIVVREKPTNAEPKAKSAAFVNLLKHAGTLEGLPEDFAEHHDDYIRGRRTR